MLVGKWFADNDGVISDQLTKDCSRRRSRQKHAPPPAPSNAGIHASDGGGKSLIPHFIGAQLIHGIHFRKLRELRWNFRRHGGMAVRSRRDSRTQEQIRLQDIVHPNQYGFTKTSHHDANRRQYRDRSGQGRNQDRCSSKGSCQAARGEQTLHSEHAADHAGGNRVENGDQRGNCQRARGNREQRGKISVEWFSVAPRFAGQRSSAIAASTTAAAADLQRCTRT